MSVKSEVSIIIPLWNGEYQLQENLPQVFTALKKFSGQAELIIADDASQDGSVIVAERLLEECPCPAQLIKNKRNLGFAGNVNKAAKFSRYDYLFLLNSDVVIKEGALEVLLEEFADEAVFAVGANAAWHVSVADFTDGFLDISRTKKVKPGSKEPQKAFWVCGGHSMFRRSMWFEMGGLDELFSPFYFEETDLCYRAWKRGYQVLWHPQAKVIHNHRQSVIKKFFLRRRIDFIAERNRLLFVWKNIHDATMLKDNLIGIMRRLKNKPSYLRVILAALLRLPPALKKRRQEKRAAQHSDKEIFDKFN